jgi:DNA-binding MarR family transcriptional regulator
VRRLHRALLDIVAAMNRPQGDEELIRAAGIRLDRALFPLLVGVETYGPIGVGELADGVGRDHTTVSRQIARLEALGLVARRDGEADRRRREAVVTDKGREMIARIDAARERRLGAIFASWPADEVETFVRLARRYADGVRAGGAAAASTRI